jgi:hypothetical protein
MTTTLASRMQSWFTYAMTQTARRISRESTYDKAVRILADPSRVRASTSADPPDYWTGQVFGDHGSYVVVAISASFAESIGLDGGRLACTCRAGRTGKHLCSHMQVAEEMRLRGEQG